MPALRLALLLALWPLATAAQDGCGAVPMAERVSKSERTRNFLALTVYPPEPGAPFNRIPEIEALPGWTDREAPVIDADGGWIYAFESDEAGVAASYFWLMRRARANDPALSPTPRQVSFSIAGVAPSRCGPDLAPSAEGEAAFGADAPYWCGRVARYLEEYLALSPLYFGRPLGPDERLDLRDPEVLWNWLRVMYHHESGRTPVVDRATFDRGMRLASDYLAAGDRLDRPLSDYAGPCAGGAAPVQAQAAPAAPAAPGQGPDAELMQVLGRLDAISANLQVLQRQVDDLRGQVQALAGR